jgi:Zn-dependent protease
MFDVPFVALGIVWYAALLVAFVFHEAAHALAAYKLGDPTAYHDGQVTLDPVPHLRREPFGMIVVPVLSYIFAGWMIGWASTPCDPHWARAHRKRAALMAMAGPAANLLVVVAAALVVRGGMLFGFFAAPDKITFTQVTAAHEPGFANSVAIVVSIVFSLNLLLFAFNLIPLPPLDGSDILVFFLSDSAAERYDAMLSQPGYRIMGLIVAWNAMDVVFGPVHSLAIRLLYPGVIYG